MSNAFRFDLGELNRVAYIRATVTMNFAQFTKRQRNALYETVDTGIVASRSGIVAVTYEKLRREFLWPRPHEWNTRSSWGGAAIYVTREEWNTKVAPFLVPMLPEGVAPEFYNSWGEPRGTLVNTTMTTSRVNKTGIKLPQPVLDFLKSVDKRNRDGVEDILQRIEACATYEFTGVSN
jgi:hypothetical protein